MWLYYSFRAEYKGEPSDLDDMLDGLRCVSAKSDIMEMEAKRER